MMTEWTGRYKLRGFSRKASVGMAGLHLLVRFVRRAGVAAMIVVMVVIGLAHLIERRFTVGQLVAGFQ